MKQSSLLEAMYLLVIRHAAAMDKEEFARTGRSDDERPLTAAGKNEMARVAALVAARERAAVSG